MSCTCPTCGQDVPNDTFRIDFDAGIVIGNGMVVALPRRELDVLELLWTKRGKRVTKDQIFEAIYSRDDDMDNISLVESHMSKMRKKVRPLGILIESRRFQGYQLLLGGRP